MRETPEAIRLRYSDRMGLYGAMQLNGKRISGYQLVVKPLLGDPQGTDPIVYPTKPQFPHMHCSWTQRIVDWKEKLQIRFGFVFFSLFAILLWCMMSIAKVGKVLKWFYNRFYIPTLKGKFLSGDHPPTDD
ncbi:uncharacterized protein LOC113566040 [Drosophila persimilis]|uniref:uncharacterized protein LOC113566040 n=1 Tax=Drosophila persimilis TaxID=7234 RepID=UPI000F07933A|nr:uncharacterized protein LOC113566040 [Drosophila persimilis]